MSSSDARTTRSMKRRREASPKAPSGSENFTSFNPLCSPPGTPRHVPSSSLRLDGLPSEIGILMVEFLDTASQASFALVNRTTASWVSKALLARITRCQTDEECEALERGDSPDTVARFIIAVTSVCIPEWEKIRFVGGIVQLHCRPDSVVPTFDIVDECRVLRAVVGSWSAEKQGELLAQYLSTELKTLKPITHFAKQPGDAGSVNQATDERIFRVLNYVMVLNATRENRVNDPGCACANCGGENTSAAVENERVERVADQKWKHLSTVVRSMLRAMPGSDNLEKQATLIHLMLGPNEFYLRLITGESLAPIGNVFENADANALIAAPFFVTFDLDDDTSSDYAEDCEYMGFEGHFESFDGSLQAFGNLFGHMLLNNVNGCSELDKETGLKETLQLIQCITKCWSFEFKLALLAFITRRGTGSTSTKRVFELKKKVMHAILETDDSLSEHCAPAVASTSALLPNALFRMLVRGAYPADDFAVFFRELSQDWSQAARNVVLQKVMHGLVKGDILTEGCECGCTPNTLNQKIFGKIAKLATMGVLALGEQEMDEAEEQAKVAMAMATPRAMATPERELDQDENPFLDGLCSPCPSAKRASVTHTPQPGAVNTPQPFGMNTPTPGTPFGMEE